MLETLSKDNISNGSNNVQRVVHGLIDGVVDVLVGDTMSQGTVLVLMMMMVVVVMVVVVRR